MIMHKEKRQPEIRFKGFTDDWEQRKLQNITSKIGSGKTPLGGEKAYTTSGVPLIRSQNIYGNKVDLSDVVYIDQDVDESMSNSRVYQDDVLLNITGASIGRSAVYPFRKNANVNQHVCIIRLADRFNSNFLQMHLSSDYGQKQINESQAGGARQGLNFEQIGKMYFDFPKIKEQDKIGTFLSTLDHLITLHQRKCDKLKIMKKALLEKMFPKEGEQVPEIRFRGFTDDWEQRKFSEITYSAGVKNKDNLLLESYSITNEKGFVPQDEQFANGGTMKDADKRMYYIVSPHSFAYNPARINVGSIGYQALEKPVIVSSLYEVFKTTDCVDDRFLWHWFKSEHFKKLIMQLQEGGVRLYFYYDKLCMGKIQLPSLIEQKKIGRQLDTIDHLITLHQRKCDKLELMKKALLEKLFV